MTLVEVEEADVAFLRKAAEVMRQGRAADLIGEVWPRGLEELASQIAWQMTLDKAATRQARANHNHEYARKRAGTA